MADRGCRGGLSEVEPKPDHPIPANYAEWYRCITVDCGIRLTKDYISQRLEALRDERALHTTQFVRSYGHDHLLRVINWFEQASTELD